jgi:hypothetical protein
MAEKQKEKIEKCTTSCATGCKKDPGNLWIQDVEGRLVRKFEQDLEKEETNKGLGKVGHKWIMDEEGRLVNMFHKDYNTILNSTEQLNN